MARSCRPPVIDTSAPPPPPPPVIVTVAGSMVSIGAVWMLPGPLPAVVTVEGTLVAVGHMDGQANPAALVTIEGPFQGVAMLSGDITVTPVGGGGGPAGTFFVGQGRVGSDTIG